jgi:hypothetical protein
MTHGVREGFAPVRALGQIVTPFSLGFLECLFRLGLDIEPTPPGALPPRYAVDRKGPF